MTDRVLSWAQHKQNELIAFLRELVECESPSDDPAAGPCMHVAPLDKVELGPRSDYRFRYWLMVGTEAQLAATLDLLWTKYSDERSQLTEPTPAVKPASP